MHVQQRRCIIPALGFCEFVPAEDGKDPYYFSRGDDQALLLAGIWEESEHKGDRRAAFAILTDEPNALIAPYHDRMPYALADDAVDAWARPGPVLAARRGPTARPGGVHRPAIEPRREFFPAEGPGSDRGGRSLALSSSQGNYARFVLVSFSCPQDCQKTRRAKAGAWNPPPRATVRRLLPRPAERVGGIPPRNRLR